jgi:hypothetical protein
MGHGPGEGGPGEGGPGEACPRPYISCRSSVVGDVGATLVVAQ